MIRYSLTAALAIGLCAGVASWALSPALGKPPKKEALKVYKRKAFFEVINSTSPVKAAPHQVSGKGEFPLRLRISDTGPSQHRRRLQVFMVMYLQRQPNTAKAGERFLVKTHPDILTTEPDEDQVTQFEWDVPLLPGDYVAHVFLCDPDAPYTPGGLLESFLPGAKEIPGEILSGTAIRVHVDPE